MTTCACDVIEISRPAAAPPPAEGGGSTGEGAGLRDDAGLQQT